MDKIDPGEPWQIGRGFEQFTAGRVAVYARTNEPQKAAARKRAAIYARTALSQEPGEKISRWRARSGNASSTARSAGIPSRSGTSTANQGAGRWIPAHTRVLPPCVKLRGTTSLTPLFLSHSTGSRVIKRTALLCSTNWRNAR